MIRRVALMRRPKSGLAQRRERFVRLDEIVTRSRWAAMP